ncbi:TolC family outer membrane protein [Vibrio diabolicus]|uniref:TolC family outer membrane protein n=1 Tax=Vibrio diabolicus TaxID=50719 RepID=UPI00062E4B8A|nr:TolC family outer membrane protein [Vibrio diabolicus]KLE24392.1 agglutination protein [Vibrio diabolicus]MCS0313345.1 TolC family outer membrane protein [Vibrio diabolicus]
MKLSNISIACFGLLIPLVSSAQTLEQAIATTFATNPDIKSAFNEYMSSRYIIDKSRGAYKPSLDIDAGIGYESIHPSDSTGKSDTEMTRKDMAITLTQLIWDGSKTLYDIDRTSADAESVRYQLLADTQNVALEVIKAYLDVVKTQKLTALSTSNLNTHKRIYTDIKKRTESGIGSVADLNQVKARLAKAQSNVLAAQNNHKDAQTAFFRLVGEAPTNLIFPHADQNFIPNSLDEAQSQAFDNHPVIKIALADVDSARFQYKQADANYFPVISFEAKQSWNDDVGGVNGLNSETQAMLRVRYNLYNGGRDSANSDSMAYQLNKAKDLRERAYRSVEQELRLSWSALELTKQQKSFLIQHVDSMSNTVIAYQKQYRIGKRTLLDLLNTENELFESRKNYLETQFAQQYAQYRTLTSTGQLLDALRVDIPEAWTQSVEY